MRRFRAEAHRGTVAPVIWTLLISAVIVVAIAGISYLAGGRRGVSDAERSSSWSQRPPDGGAGL